LDLKREWNSLSTREEEKNIILLSILGKKIKITCNLKFVFKVKDKLLGKIKI